MMRHLSHESGRAQQERGEDLPYDAGAVEMSKNALHFANAAKKVTMQPVVNEVLNERARIRQLQTEINGLRQQLVRILPALVTPWLLPKHIKLP